MREIKFRAWLDITRTIESMEENQSLWEFIRSVDGCILMQYTGLKDKNGKDIYEGDIVSTDLDRPYNIIEFKSGGFIQKCKDGGFGYDDRIIPTCDNTGVLKYQEVIGNIYENPELLKEDLCVGK